MKTPKPKPVASTKLATGTLANMADICRAMNLSTGPTYTKLVLKLFAAAGVKEVHSFSNGRGTTHLYEPSQVQPVVDKYVAEQLTKIRPAGTPPQFVEAPVAVSTGDSAQIKVLRQQVEHLLDEMRELNRVQTMKLTEQNRALLTVLDKQVEMLVAIMKDLGIRSETPT